MAKKTTGKTGKSVSSSFVNTARRKRRQRIGFAVLTAFLALGLVGSSVFWVFDFGGPTPPEAGQVQQEMPPEQQIADLENRLQEEPDNVSLLGRLAQLYWQTGRGREAVDTYLKALEIKPGDTEMRRDLALTYYLLGDYNDAVQQIEAVLEKDPQDATAYYYLGQFYAYRSDEGRDVDKGIEALEKFVDLRKEGMEVTKARQMIEELKSGHAG